MNIQNFEDITEIDESREPVLAVRFGRGRTGGSTFLDLLIQLARRAGRPVIVGDGDRGNATLASFYPPKNKGGALQPRSDDIADVCDWVTEVCSLMGKERTSLALDMGGGDRVLSEHARDMALPEFCEAIGAQPLAIYMVGPDPEDFEHVFRIFKAGYFATERVLLIENESLVRAGKNASGAFEAISSHPGYDEMTEAARVIRMPKLACMGELRAAGLSLFGAAAGERGAHGKELSMGHQFQVKAWLNKMEARFSEFGVEEWLL